MRDGAERTDVPYAWPSLLRPEGRARIAYLDLNHWINLAKASAGHPDGRRHRNSLDALRGLHRFGEVLLPLSATHYMEMTRIKSGRQRHDVASVMEELSGFDCLMNRTVVIRLELEAAFDELLGTQGRVFEAIPLIGNGALQALGMRGGLRVKDAAGVDVTERARLELKGGPRAFDAWRRQAERKLNWSMLAGPTEQEEPELRSEGWDPEKATAVSHERAKQEEEQSARLSEDDRWRRGRLRDVVGARYLALEVFEMLQEESARRDVGFAALLPSTQDARSGACRIPDSARLPLIYGPRPDHRGPGPDARLALYSRYPGRRAIPCLS
jgi:hypothetical protein